MTYLTYEEYLNIGGTLDKTAFDRKITRTCGIIDNATYGRIESLHGIPKPVKELCRDLVELLVKNEDAETVQSKSQSAGGVSESITYAVSTKSEQAEQINSIIYDYLANVYTKNGTSLLYRGCGC